MSSSILSARGLCRDHGQGASLVHAVDDVDLDVDPGECVAIVGPSGCGKSSLLYLLGGLQRPTGGMIRLASTHCLRVSWRGCVAARSGSSFRRLSSSMS